MAETQIEWTDATWNPVAGCSIISSGCANCYAMGMARRLAAMGVEKYEGLTVLRGNRPIWNGIVKEDNQSLLLPLKWRKPRNIFVNSMSDLFHENVTDDFIVEVWNVMRKTPQHNYQILTKRPERMVNIVSKTVGVVLPNVWLGTSVENSEAVYRVEHLRICDAAIRFISFEPLLGAVGNINLQGIHWAIVGGESGVNARPLEERWIDEIYAKCMEHGTTFFFKQWGTWGIDRIRRSKKANGRTYRGRMWDEMPQPKTESSEFKLKEEITREGAGGKTI